MIMNMGHEHVYEHRKPHANMPVHTYAHVSVQMSIHMLERTFVFEPRQQIKYIVHTRVCIHVYTHVYADVMQMSMQMPMQMSMHISMHMSMHMSKLKAKYRSRDA